MMTIKQFLGFVCIMLLGMIGTYFIGLNTEHDPIDDYKVMEAYRRGQDTKQAEIELRANKLYKNGTDLTNSDIEYIIFGESQL